MYRPQFPYPIPDGCRDEDFVYYFDGSNVPLLNQSVSGLSVPNIPLILEQDADFYWRGFSVGMYTTGAGPVEVQPNVAVKFQDCYQNNLSEGLIPATQYAFPQNPVTFYNGMYNGPFVPLEPEIFCPRGGVILFFMQAPTLASPSYVMVSLFGVKRFQECKS